ncbi:ROK family protein [Pseudonocardia parietis]|uniref:Glucokinase n=1 Tax=Pseudonocardia parietis TaxID=570936 RepID=A0ABS4VZH0_9PSEU|nr:ROK family protein [Pseudonocardia parietis]MBP2369346.1 glucokinase [Pseudonocardia parietis]
MSVGPRALTIGVDVGGTSVRAGVVDADGEVLDTATAPTPRTDDALEVAIAGTVTELRGRYPVRAAGLALAGFVDAPRGLVRYAPHLSWRDAPVAGRISERLGGLPVVVEHDANSAALAERRYGAAAGASTVVLVAIGTGIGGALLLGGELFRGAHGVAPELGHLRVVPDGRACPCGKRGCWERYCSGTALAATALELISAGDVPGPSVLAREAARDPGRITGRRVAAAAREGDPVARAALDDLGRWLGEGLSLVADVFDPDLVVVAGGVSVSAPLFLDAAREHYARIATGASHRPLARIRTAQLGAAAAVVGAATLAREGAGQRREPSS